MGMWSRNSFHQMTKIKDCDYSLEEEEEEEGVLRDIKDG